MVSTADFMSEGFLASELPGKVERADMITVQIGAGRADEGGNEDSSREAARGNVEAVVADANRRGE